MNRTERYLSAARSLATKSDFNRQRIGCVAVYKNKIISKGCNSEKTHTLQKSYNKYRKFMDKPACDITAKVHAEVNCLHKIINSDIDWSRVDLYIYRIMRSKPFGMSKPCKGCMALIRSLGIRNIYYTGDNAIVHEHIIYDHDSDYIF